jgi:hypothetical protein
MVQTSFDFYKFLIRAGVATRLSSVLKGFFMIFLSTSHVVAGAIKNGPAWAHWRAWPPDARWLLEIKNKLEHFLESC